MYPAVSAHLVALLANKKGSMTSVKAARVLVGRAHIGINIGGTFREGGLMLQSYRVNLAFTSLIVLYSSHDALCPSGDKLIGKIGQRKICKCNVEIALLCESTISRIANQRFKGARLRQPLGTM